MKLRESGMPEEAFWETLFDVPLILDRLEIGAQLRDVVELGCGFGTFTVPVARRISGVINALDIEPNMVARTRERADAAGLMNVRCQLRDVMRDGFGCDAASQNAALLFNILHCEEPLRVLSLAADAVRSGGWVLAIHWRFDPVTPRDPALDIRPRPEQITSWVKQGRRLELVGEVLDLPPWHYGLRLRRL